jgi:chromosome segregation ATPase
MKKILLMAFVALSVSAMAQKVTPVTISLAEFKVDSLRSLYMTEPIMYRASLDAVAQALEKNAAELKAAKAELKNEQQLTKEMANSLKGASKMTASMKKLYDKEEGELKGMQKVVAGQQKMLTKQKELNAETRETYTAFLEKQQKELGYALRELAERQRAVSELETTIQNHQTKLQTYNQEVVQKANTLANIETELKARVASVKTEQKAAKSMQ